jgi:LmbE family N-acetylglucosaminyl deacetylase
VDITPYLDQKIAAIKCHVSQVKDPAGMEKRLREAQDMEYVEEQPHYTEAYRLLRLT